MKLTRITDVDPNLLLKPVKKKKRKKKSNLEKRRDNCRSGLWLKKADSIWRECIHLKYVHCCAVNNDKCSGPLNAHHLISRSHRLTRHDLMNGILLCYTHHLRSTECSPHGGPIGFNVFMETRFPIQHCWSKENRFRDPTEKPNYMEAVEHLEKEKVRIINL